MESAVAQQVPYDPKKYAGFKIDFDNKGGISASKQVEDQDGKRSILTIRFLSPKTALGEFNVKAQEIVDTLKHFDSIKTSELTHYVGQRILRADRDNPSRTIGNMAWKPIDHSGAIHEIDERVTSLVSVLLTDIKPENERTPEIPSRVNPAGIIGFKQLAEESGNLEEKIGENDETIRILEIALKIHPSLQKKQEEAITNINDSIKQCETLVQELDNIASVNESMKKEDRIEVVIAAYKNINEDVSREEATKLADQILTAKKELNKLKNEFETNMVQIKISMSLRTAIDANNLLKITPIALPTPARLRYQLDPQKDKQRIAELDKNDYTLALVKKNERDQQIEESTVGLQEKLILELNKQVTSITTLPQQNKTLDHIYIKMDQQSKIFKGLITQFESIE